MGAEWEVVRIGGGRRFDILAATVVVMKACVEGEDEMRDPKGTRRRPLVCAFANEFKVALNGLGPPRQCQAPKAI